MLHAMPVADSTATLCERTQSPPLNQSQVAAMTKPRPSNYTVGHWQKCGCIAVKMVL